MVGEAQALRREGVSAVNIRKQRIQQGVSIKNF